MRTLSVDLDNINDNLQKSPAWKVYIYDIKSTRSNAIPDTISRLVQGATLDAITGPLDLTDFVKSIQFTERSSDFTTGTLQGNSIAVTVIDRGMVYDPVGGSESRWLRAGNIIVLKEGDTNLAENLWITTFTGTLIGRAGASDRDRSDNQTLEIAAVDRMSAMLKLNTTSQAFPQGIQYQFMMQSILEDEVGMASAEFNLSGVGAKLTTQAVTQMVDESPMISLAKLGFIDGAVPRFRGDGVLEFVSNTSSKGINVAYPDENNFVGFNRPFSPLEDPNEVEVIGLESTMTKISQPSQILASASITLGFFGGNSSIKVKWSDDNTQQADAPRLKINQSVTGALIPFGAEDVTYNVDDDGGVRSGRIEVDGAFYAPLVVVLYGGRIAASFIPDGNVGFIGGSTIPLGRLVEGIISIATSLIQATIGRGDYDIVGAPYEYVFREIRGIARVGEVPFVDIRPISIENHLVDTQPEANSIALRELRTVRKRGNTWGASMRHDLRLEPSDKFSLPDDRQFIVTEIQRVIDRNEIQLATMALFETTLGVTP